MADDRLNAATSAVPLPCTGLHAILLFVGQVDFGVVEYCRGSFVAFVAVGMLWSPAGYLLSLVKCQLQGMAVVWVAVNRLNAYDPTVFRGADQRNFAAEFVLLVGLALGNTLNLGGLHAVELVLVIALLVKNPLCPLKHCGKQSVRGQAFATNVTDYTAKEDAEFLLLLFGPVHLTGVAVTSLHDESALAKALVSLAKFNALSPCQSD